MTEAPRISARPTMADVLPCDPEALLVIGANIASGPLRRELDKIFGPPTLPFDATPPGATASART